MADWTGLVQEIVNGDRAAERTLVARMLPAIRVMIRRRGFLSWADVDDLAQEVVTDLLVALRDARLNDHEKLNGFVARMVHNICANQHQRQQRLAPLDIEPVSENPMDLPPAHAEQHERWGLVVRAIRALTVARDREILIEFYIRGHEKSQVCAKLQLEPAQFDRVIHRAKTRVRSLLASATGE